MSAALRMNHAFSLLDFLGKSGNSLTLAAFSKGIILLQRVVERFICGRFSGGLHGHSLDSARMGHTFKTSAQLLGLVW
jgi:hypothetical protein